MPLAVQQSDIESAVAEGLAPLKAIIDEVLFIHRVTYNLQCGDGRDEPFKIIKFENGDIPTNPPHNLPGLTNRDDIIALTGPQATAYLKGYNIRVPRTLQARRNAIRMHIGCAPQL